MWLEIRENPNGLEELALWGWGGQVAESRQQPASLLRREFLQGKCKSSSLFFSLPRAFASGSDLVFPPALSREMRLLASFPLLFLLVSTKLPFWRLGELQ